MKYLDIKITDLEEKIGDIQKRWAFDSVKPDQVQELEALELKLEGLKKQKIAQEESCGA